MRPRTTGPAIFARRRSTGSTLSTHQRAASGKLSRVSVWPVGAQSTIDDVEVAALIVVRHPEQVRQFLHARQDGNLLRLHLLHALPDEERRQPLLDDPPPRLDVEVDVAFLGPEVLRHLDRLRPQRHVEGVGQAVSRVGAQDDRAIAHLRRS